MATEDKVSMPSEEKKGMPEGKGKRKRSKSLAKFFKVWATPLTILIAVAGLLWGVYQFNAQQLTSAQMQARQEAAIAAQTLDQQRQNILDSYLDRMSDLLLTYHLSSSKPGDEVRALARARTFTALRNLDGSRRGALIRFLWKAGLINGPQPIIDLSEAFLIDVNMSGADLSGANLSGANMGWLYLGNGKSACANLSQANLSGAYLIETNLSGANFRQANLGYANLSGADLSGADLSGANLLHAYVTNVQLAQAKSLQGATMPDGSIHP